MSVNPIYTESPLAKPAKVPRCIDYKSEGPWLAARCLLVTASEIPTILELTDPGSPWYQTPAELWAVKTGSVESKTVSAEMQMYRDAGHRLEPVIKAWYRDVTGYPIRSGKPFAITTHKRYPWLGATLDFKAKHPEHGWFPVQAKNVGYSGRGKWISGPRGSEKVKSTPEHIRVQVCFEAEIVGAPVGGVAALLGGNTLEVREIPAFPEIAALIPRLKDFHRHVALRIPLNEPLPEVSP